MTIPWTVAWVMAPTLQEPLPLNSRAKNTASLIPLLVQNWVLIACGDAHRRPRLRSSCWHLLVLLKTERTFSLTRTATSRVGQERHALSSSPALSTLEFRLLSLRGMMVVRKCSTPLPLRLVVVSRARERFQIRCFLRSSTKARTELVPTLPMAPLTLAFLWALPRLLLTPHSLPLWSAVDANNVCNPLPDDTPDLSQRIVLLEFLDSRATQCYPPDQGANIAAKGGKYMMYYTKSNSTMRDDPFVYADGITGVAKAVPYIAEKWLSLLSQGTTVTVTVPSNTSQTYFEELENHETGGYVAGQLSSWGPSWELDMTPQVVAPGENILSTFLTALGSYRVMTGTSMSAPLVAGIYAMLGEVYGKLDPKRMRRILTHTSKPLAWFDGTKADPTLLAPIPQQGAGLVQAWDAAHTTIELDVDSLMLNDTEHFAGTHTFSITNTGSSEAVLQMSLRKAVTMYTMDPTSNPLRTDVFPNATATEYASASFSRMLRADVLRGKEELGALAGWPLTYVARAEKRAWVNGLLADGTVLEEGEYRLRVQALRIFGNENEEEDWDVVETVAFGLKYSES
jgi:hypothetical protein